MKILVTGASGMVGSDLVSRLEEIGHKVLKLSRKEAEESNEVKWDPKDGFDEAEFSKLEGINAVVHLAGESVANGNWSEEKKNKIRESRVLGTRTLVDALGRLKDPPKIFVSASAIGFYGDRDDEILTEESEAGSGFLPDVCKEWEAEAFKAEDFGARVVVLRTGIVLSKEGGALAKMITPFSYGVGGVVGTGKQYMSWITLTDLVKLIIFLVNNDEVQGVVNATTPNPVTNEEFTKTMGKVVNRPTILPVPGFGIKLIFGEMGEKLLLEGARVLPEKLEKYGFEFEYPNLEEALKRALE